MADILRSVVEEGTGWRAALHVPVAGKTGTSDHNTNAWFIGFAEGLTTTVWLGEDHLLPMRYSVTEDGKHERERVHPDVAITGVHASVVWGEYMRNVLAELETDAQERKTAAPAETGNGRALRPAKPEGPSEGGRHRGDRSGDRSSGNRTHACHGRGTGDSTGIGGVCACLSG